MHLNIACHCRRLFILAICSMVASPCASAEELTDDASRGQLLRYAASLDVTKAFPDNFFLPSDAAPKANWFFGIDVSHYDGAIDWDVAYDQKIGFAYVKASQGKSKVDSFFRKNWAALRNLPQSSKIYRGAYHFVSAKDDPILQAKNFYDVVGNPVGGDLPPTLDLEWDVSGSSSNPDTDDAWKSIPTKAKRIEIIKAVAAEVEQRFKVKPIFYTNASWWADRIGDAPELSGYRIWIADYSRKSQLNEVPKSVPGYSTPLWQFTERGRAKEGFTGALDVNVFKGKEADFKAAFGLK